VAVRYNRTKKTHWDWNTVLVLMVTEPVEMDVKPYLLRCVPYSSNSTQLVWHVNTCTLVYHNVLHGRHHCSRVHCGVPMINPVIYWKAKLMGNMRLSEAGPIYRQSWLLLHRHLTKHMHCASCKNTHNPIIQCLAKCWGNSEQLCSMTPEKMIPLISTTVVIKIHTTYDNSLYTHLPLL